MLGGVERRQRGARAAPAFGQPYARRPWRRSPASAVYGGAAGFVLGAAFWIVLGLQELTGSEVPPKLAPLQDAQDQTPPGCTSLAIDRRKGRTISEPCLEQMLPLREALATGLTGRGVP